MASSDVTFPVAASLRGPWVCPHLLCMLSVVLLSETETIVINSEFIPNTSIVVALEGVHIKTFSPVVLAVLQFPWGRGSLALSLLP